MESGYKYYVQPISENKWGASYHRDREAADAKLLLCGEPACLVRLKDYKILARNYYLRETPTGIYEIIFPKKINNTWI